MERLTDIIARVEKLAFAQEEERQASASVLQSPSSEEQPTLPLTLPILESPFLPEYIQAEAFLEVSGFFTPSSKRIRRIYTKEKTRLGRLAEVRSTSGGLYAGSNRSKMSSHLRPRANSEATNRKSPDHASRTIV